MIGEKLRVVGAKEPFFIRVVLVLPNAVPNVLVISHNHKTIFVVTS